MRTELTWLGFCCLHMMIPTTARSAPWAGPVTRLLGHLVVLSVLQLPIPTRLVVQAPPAVILVSTKTRPARIVMLATIPLVRLRPNVPSVPQGTTRLQSRHHHARVVLLESIKPAQQKQLAATRAEKENSVRPLLLPPAAIVWSAQLESTAPRRAMLVQATA